MKKLIYIMLSLCCLVFYSCGMTEPWKDYLRDRANEAITNWQKDRESLLC